MQQPEPIRLCGLLVCCVLLVPGAFAADGLPSADPADGRLTDLGRYRVAYASTLQPLAINRMHAWVIHVANADGRPIEEAELTLSGGMPAHDHGLPSAPRMTTRLGGGNYLVEGVKFHMAGAWEVVVTVDAAAGVDSVTWLLGL